MHCLLCHEKIPRLRAWTTKSEFCSDEHAALYKRQTLERLLTSEPESEPSDEPLAAASVPTAAASPPQPAETVSSDSERVSPPGKSSGRPDDTEAAADALQRLTPAGESSGAEAPRQSAEEALEALRQLVGDSADVRQEAPALDELNESETAALEVRADFGLEPAKPSAAADDELDGFAPPELAADGLPARADTAAEDELAAPSLEFENLEVDAAPAAAVDQAELGLSADVLAPPEPQAASPTAVELDVPDPDAVDLAGSAGPAREDAATEAAATSESPPSQDLHELGEALAEAADADLQAPSLELPDQLAADTDLEAPSLELPDQLAADADLEAPSLELPDQLAADADLEAPSLELPDQLAADADLEAPSLELPDQLAADADLEAPSLELPDQLAADADLEAPSLELPDQLAADTDLEAPSLELPEEFAADTDLEAPSLELAEELAAEADLQAADRELLSELDDVAESSEGVEELESEAHAKVLQFPLQECHESESGAEEDLDPQPQDEPLEEPAAPAAVSHSKPPKRSLRLSPVLTAIALQPTEVQLDIASEKAVDPNLDSAADVLTPRTTRPAMGPLACGNLIRTAGGLLPRFEALLGERELSEAPEFQLPAFSADIIPPEQGRLEMPWAYSSEPETRGARPVVEAPSGSLLDGLAPRAKEAETFSAEFLEAVPQDLLEPRDAIVRTPPPEPKGRPSDDAPDGAPSSDATEDQLQAADGY